MHSARQRQTHAARAAAAAAHVTGASGTTGKTLIGRAGTRRAPIRAAAATRPAGLACGM
jgi:hypothetical protein